MMTLLKSPIFIGLAILCWFGGWSFGEEREEKVDFFPPGQTSLELIRSLVKCESAENLESTIETFARCPLEKRERYFFNYLTVLTRCLCSYLYEPHRRDALCAEIDTADSTSSDSDRKNYGPFSTLKSKVIEIASDEDKERAGIIGSTVDCGARYADRNLTRAEFKDCVKTRGSGMGSRQIYNEIYYPNFLWD